MAVTDIRGPGSGAAIGTGLGDGVNYASSGTTNVNRVLHTATSPATGVWASSSQPGGDLFKGYFSDQIPTTATVNGIEVVAGTDFDGSGNSRIGSFGSSSGNGIIRCYLYNGTSYSSALAWDDSVSYTGITLSDSNRTATFAGSNKNYHNNTAGDDILFGGTSDLSGLAWDPANQANWGWAIATTNVSGTFVAGFLRGVGLRVTYTPTFPVEKWARVDHASIVYIDGAAGNTISKWNGVTIVASSPPGAINTTYQFEDQPAGTEGGISNTELHTANWSPSLTHSDWANGASAVNGTYWGRTSNKTVKGWNIALDGTPSGNTGPSGGVNVSDGSHVTDSSGENYIYSETSGGKHAYAFVTRMPGVNFSTAMLNTGTDLNLKFWIHAYSNDDKMGDLFVYIDTNSTSNHSTATELLALDYNTDLDSDFSANGSSWVQKTVSLNSYRTTDATHYIYFVTQNGSGFTSDLAIDGIQIIEA